MGGTPSQVQTGGVLHPRSGWGGGTPSQVWMGGTLSKIRTGRYPPSAEWGTLHPGLDGGTTGRPPPISRMGYLPSRPQVPPIQDWMGYPPHPRLDGVPPPPPSAKRALATLRVVYLLRSRRRIFLFFKILCTPQALSSTSIKSKIYAHCILFLTDRTKRNETFSMSCICKRNYINMCKNSFRRQPV